jgi:hypothetical protein
MKTKLDTLAPHQKYIGLDGKVYPGGSTIAKQLQDPGPLITWANREGLAGRDCRKSLSKAATIGTIAHWMCECHVKGQEPDLDDFSASDIDKAENSFLKFLEFWQKGGWTLVSSECQLVWPEMGYGGTLDLVASPADGKLTLIDFKTGKGIYAEHYIQTSGYRELWNHASVQMIEGQPVTRNPPAFAIEETVVLRIGKDEAGEFEAHWVSEEKHDYYFRGFLLGVQAYSWKQEGKK